MRYTIEVTAEDIRRAREMAMARDSGDPAPPLEVSCPIALGAMRALRAERVKTICDDWDGPAAWSLDVSSPDAEGGRATTARVFVLPEEANEFIERFDEGEAVEPFEFTVEG